MLGRIVLVSAAALAVAGCGESSEKGAQSNAAERARPKRPERPAYCFFKSEELKGWKVSVDGDGNVVLAGKAHMKDARYRPELGKAEISGTAATIAPTITQNGGYASPDNWWDVKATIPDSSSVRSVTIKCGAKIVAELEVKRPG